MKNVVLEYLFKIIYRMRRIEMSLLNKQQVELANKIREANKAFSAIRNRLITAQLAIASEKLDSAVSRLQSTSDELQAYLDEREAADVKLKGILNNLPVILSLVNSLID